MKPHYVLVIFQKILQLMTWRKKGVSKLSFFVDYNAIDTSDILDIKRFLMNER